MITCSQDFITALKQPIKQLYVKFEFYDSNDVFIDEFTKKITRDDLGSISVDRNRPIRRSFSFSLNNTKNEFDWGESNLIWLDKRVKLFIGLKLLNGEIEYVPQGYFIITQPSNSHNFEGKRTNLTGQDKAFLFTDKRGKFVNEQIISAGVNIATAIKLIVDDIEDKFNFDNITETVPYELTYHAGENKWKAMKELAEFAQCDLYYDVNGYLRLKRIDLNELQQYPPVWTYKYGDKSERFYAGNIRVLDDEIMANHIRVLGGSSQTAEVIYDLIVDENDGSELWTDNPYSIQKIGELLYLHNNGNPDPLITTELEAKARAKWELMKRLGYTEQVNMQISPNWVHDVGDIIEIQDDENSVSGRYIIESFELPLNPDLMNCTCRKERKVIDDWNFI